MKPTVSIIIPVYNTEQYVGECIESVISQTLKDIEIIIVDDHSTDGSREIIEAYLHKDNRIRTLFLEQHSGELTVRNRGIAVSTGKYICCLDSDDHLAPNALEIASEKMDEKNVDVLQMPMKVVNCDNSPEARIEKNQQNVTPVSGRLEGRDVFLACFRDHRYIVGLIGKMFNGDLFRRILPELKEDYYLRAADCYTYYVLSYYSESYYGMSGDPLYYYCFGRGSTGSGEVKLRKVEAYSTQKQVYEALLDFASGKKGDGIDHIAILDHFKKTWTRECIQLVDDISADKADEAMKIVRSYWSEEELSEGMSTVVRKRIISLMNEYGVRSSSMNESQLISSDVKVSVIVPVYNSAQYLRQCLDSIVGQSLKEMEIIIVDDGSDDGSKDIIEEYKNKYRKIKVIYQEHQYAGVARNKGKAIARGKYLVFWDSDDYFKKDALKLMYEQCEADHADVCICGGRQFFDEEQFECPGPRYLKKSEIPETIPFNCLTAPDHIISITVEAPWNKMFRREYIESKGLDFQPVRNANDVYFTVNALCLAEAVTIVNKQLVVYRKSKGTGLVTSVKEGLHNAIKTWTDTADNLRSEGRFPSRSFANRALESLIYLLSNTTDWEVFREEYEYLQNGVLERLSIISPDDDEYYFIKWQNEAARRMFTDTPEEFDRYLSNFYFSRDAATTARTRSKDEKNKKTIKELTASSETAAAENLKLKEEADKARSEIKKKDRTIAGLNGTIRDQNDKIDLLGMSVRERDLRIDELEKAIKDRDNKIKKTEKKINDIKGSVSFKIGRGLTWLPRKVKGVLKR